MDPQRDFVVTGKNAYMMLPQEFICGPTVQDVTWSPDGDRVAVFREFVDISPAEMGDMLVGKENDHSNLEPEEQIIEWSAITRKATTVYRLKKSQGHILSMQWIAGSSSLIVETVPSAAQEAAVPDRVDSGSNRSSLFILSASGQTIGLALLDGTVAVEVNPSPYKPLAALVEHPNAGQDLTTKQGSPMEREPATIQFFGTDGVLSEPMKMPAALSIPFWSNNGKLYVLTIVRKPNEKRATRSWFVLDRAARKFTPSDPPSDQNTMMMPPSTGELQVSDMNATLSGMKVGINAPTVVIQASELQKDPELSIVTTDGQQGELSPKLNAVSYRSQGSLMVRAMVKVPLEAYQKARVAALKAKVISQAKQVALALIMYANDYDDNLMSNSSNWQSALEPYLKNSALTAGFNYTFAGGNMDSIAEPANTMLGYIDGPGGRAIAYTDGHVRWFPNTP